MDGTDFKINEPSRPIDAGWYSHKINHAGARYEVAISIQGGDIVWFHGPFAAGAFNDRVIARDHGLEWALEPGEMYVADGGYQDGQRRASTPTGVWNMQEKMKSKVRARHEAVNSRFKFFHCLRDCYRHHINKHVIVARAVANIVQVEIEEEKPLFSLYYSERHA